MSCRTKLLIILNTDYFLISHRLQIVRESINSGYEVHVAAQFTQNFKQLKELDIVFHPLKIHRTRSDLKSLLETTISIYKIIKKVNPQILHLISIKPILLGGLAMHFLLKPTSIIYSISGLGFIFTNRNFKTIIKKRLAILFYKIALNHRKIKVIVQNKDDLNFIKTITGISTENTILIPGSGVDLGKFKPSKSKIKKPVVIFPSRIVLSKGIQEFIDSAKELKSLAKFVVCGKLDLECKDAVSEKLLNQWINKGFIEYWGFSNSMEKVLAKSSIVVLPSYREGLPKVLCEAAAAGKPVITTDVPGCRESIIQNKTGLLVPMKNSKELTYAIKRLIDDDELSTKMGRNGRKLAIKKFDIKDIVKKHIDLYSECI